MLILEYLYYQDLFERTGMRIVYKNTSYLYLFEGQHLDLSLPFLKQNSLTDEENFIN